MLLVSKASRGSPSIPQLHLSLGQGASKWHRIRQNTSPWGLLKSPHPHELHKKQYDSKVTGHVPSENSNEQSYLPVTAPDMHVASLHPLCPVTPGSCTRQVTFPSPQFHILIPH